MSLQSICRFIEVEVWIRVCAACAERQSLSIMHHYWPGWRRSCTAPHASSNTRRTSSCLSVLIDALPFCAEISEEKGRRERKGIVKVGSFCRALNRIEYAKIGIGLPISIHLIDRWREHGKAATFSAQTAHGMRSCFHWRHRHVYVLWVNCKFTSLCLPCLGLSFVVA